MHKRSAEDFLGCGIDVSAVQLVIALETEGGGYQQRSFSNRASGHQALILWLQKAGRKVRVCLEATGLYSLDLALVLHDACGIEVAVLNPKLVNRFAATLCRNKTDPADAQVLAEYARRMPFQRWQPPRAVALQLRAVTRHIAALTQQHTRESNRLHAASASTAAARCVQQDLKRSLRDLGEAWYHGYARSDQHRGSLMKETLVQQVTRWFAANCEKLSELFPTVRFRLEHANDNVRGKVNIELSGQNTAGTITVWNKGDVMALLLDIASKKEQALDDRKLTPQDEIAFLLGKYVDRFAEGRRSSSL